MKLMLSNEPTPPDVAVIEPMTGDEKPPPFPFGNQQQYSCHRVMLRKILVPVDFTDCSYKALPYALALAREFGASILLVCVIRPLYPGGRFESCRAHQRLRQSVERRLADLAKREVLPHAPVRHYVREGVSCRVINEFARKTGADLVVLSTRGRGGFASAILGSTARRVVERAPCPVLVVRERQHEFVAVVPATGAKAP
ncbi:MAG: universal stress protein [Verrucomicrobia bacterium]|nr:universal stress protein [Verrucomicrobiota bacterium]